MRIPEMRNPAVDSDRVRKVRFIQNKIPVSTLSLPRKEEWAVSYTHLTLPTN